MVMPSYLVLLLLLATSTGAISYDRFCGQELVPPLSEVSVSFACSSMLANSNNYTWNPSGIPFFCGTGKVGNTVQTCLYLERPCVDGTVCRPAIDICDVAEICHNGRCPEDLVRNSTVMCRPSWADCDPPEYCDGHNSSCPESDDFVRLTMVCSETWYERMFGFVGGITLAICTVPQIFKILWTRSSKDFSYAFLVMYLFGLSFTLVYLILVHATSGWICMVVEISLGGCLLLTKILNETLFKKEGNDKDTDKDSKHKDKNKDVR